MGALATAVRIRHDLHSRLINARARTDEVFRVVREEAMYDRPIPERHRIIFYVGHVEAFDWNCQQHITPRYTRDEIQRALAPIEARMQELEEENERLRSEVARP